MFSFHWLLLFAIMVVISFGNIDFLCVIPTGRGSTFEREVEVGLIFVLNTIFMTLLDLYIRIYIIVVDFSWWLKYTLFWILRECLYVIRTVYQFSFLRDCRETVREKLTMVGTIRKNKADIPKQLVETKWKSVHSSLCFWFHLY